MPRGGYVGVHVRDGRLAHAIAAAVAAFGFFFLEETNACVDRYMTVT